MYTYYLDYELSLVKNGHHLNIVEILRFFENSIEMSLLGLRSRESDYNDFMSRDQKCES